VADKNRQPTISELIATMSADIDPGPTPEEFARGVVDAFAREAPAAPKHTGPRVDACREDDDD
jgi:hypothetical protein